MTHFKHYKSGSVFGILYRFDSQGDRIPTHKHDETHAHNIVVIRGSIQLVTPEESRLCGPGVHDFDWSCPHEITAAENHSEVLHLFLNGQPDGYEALPENELCGTL